MNLGCIFGAIHRVISDLELAVPDKDQVSVRLLLNKNTENVSAAALKYNEQPRDIVQLRRSQVIHDRVVFVYNYVC